jgi:hypothetical protein
MFVLGGIITYLLVYVGIARPASMELSLIRRQMSTLEQSVWEIAGHEGTAVEGAELISVLAEQRTQLSAAKETLAAIRELNLQIAQEAQQVSVAHSALSELANLKELVIESSEDALAAADVVATSEMVCDRLAAAATKTQQALQAGDELLALSDGIINQSDNVEDARVALEGLIGIRELIDRQAPELQQTKQHVEAFVSLKDTILTESIDLADAIETVELTSDLSKQFNEAVQSFEQMRNWMIEIVASESLLDRAQTTFQALTGVSNLHNLAPVELRAIAKAMTQTGELHVARKPEQGTETPFASPDVFEEIDAILGE